MRVPYKAMARRVRGAALAAWGPELSAATTARLRSMEDRMPPVLLPRDDIGRCIGADPRYEDAPVLLGPGTWDIKETVVVLRSDLHIRGTGFQTVLSTDGNRSILSVTGSQVRIQGVRFEQRRVSGSLMPLLYLRNATRIELLDCWVDGNGASGGVTAINVRDLFVSRCLIENIDHRNSSITTSAIYCETCSDAVIMANRVETTLATNAIDLNGGGNARAVIAGNHCGTVANIIRYEAAGGHFVDAGSNLATLAAY